MITFQAVQGWIKTREVMVTATTTMIQDIDVTEGYVVGLEGDELSPLTMVAVR
jgi:hypothetical protein